MNRIHRFIINVECPRDHRVHPVEMGYARNSNGDKVFFPCNGCENLNGSETCHKCTAALTIMFQKGHDPIANRRVIPDFAVLQ